MENKETRNEPDSGAGGEKGRKGVSLFSGVFLVSPRGGEKKKIERKSVREGEIYSVDIVSSPGFSFFWGGK